MLEDLQIKLEDEKGITYTDKAYEINYLETVQERSADIQSSHDTSIDDMQREKVEYLEILLNDDEF